MRMKADELYICMDLMETDLHKIIQSKQSLDLRHVARFMFQLFRGLEYLHANGVLHRDLKPANLLVNSKCELKISDFGLARVEPDDIKKKAMMTHHVVTRWYRPPELMLSPQDPYTAAVDMWSAGCIMIELLIRAPLFPGSDFLDQLARIFHVIGKPTSDDIAKLHNAQARKFLNSLPNRKRTPFGELFPDMDKAAADLLDNLLVYDPSKRISASQALQHPFFYEYFGLELPQHPLIPPVKLELPFETQEMSVTELKYMIRDEINSFRQDKDSKMMENRRIYDNSDNESNNNSNNSNSNSNRRALFEQRSQSAYQTRELPNKINLSTHSAEKAPVLGSKLPPTRSLSQAQNKYEEKLNRAAIEAKRLEERVERVIGGKPPKSKNSINNRIVSNNNNNNNSNMSSSSIYIFIY